MEIDPRLHARRDRDTTHAIVGAGTNTNTTTTPQSAHPYTLPPVAVAAAGPPPQPPTSEYPDPSPFSHFSPSSQEQAVSASSARSSSGYYPAPTQTHSPHAAYPTEAAADPHDPFADLKRPRACEACRQLKVRCEPDAQQPTGSCKRCAKAGRACVVTAPTRKRQKKTDSRVAELERKIDALTASLQASQGHELLLRAAPASAPAPAPAPVPAPTAEHTNMHAHASLHDVHEQTGRRWLGGVGPPAASAVTLAGSKRGLSGEVRGVKEGVSVGSEYPRGSSPVREPPRENDPSKHWRGPWSSVSSTSKSEAGAAGVQVDIIDRGLVSLAVASEAFDRYVNDRVHNMPFVVFSPGTTMADVRKSKPTLLHAIVASSVGQIQPDIHLTLLDELYKVLAERIVIKGEKSLELVQALVVACNWYAPPDHFEELKFYHLTHMAVTLAMDLGMNRKMLTRNKPLPFYREMALKSLVLDPDSPETRRTWLGCYFTAVQVAVSLRRVLLVRWQPYMDECLKILENSPAALPSDKAVIQWAKLAHLTEDITFQFATDDAVSNIPFDDPKMQYTLKIFEKQLEQWKREMTPEIYTPIMQQAEYIVNIYMYENAMLIDVDDSKKTGDKDSGTISAAHMNALSQCLTSIHQALDTICSNDIKDFVSWPTVCLARASFAAVSLIKLYALVTFPGSHIGQVIDPASLKVEYYLNKVIEHYSAAGELPGGRTPGKFSVVLAMLRSWFVKRKDHNQALREAFGTGPVSCATVAVGEPEADKPQSQGQTRLQLLSEVAMKDPSTRSATSHPPPPHRPSYAPHSSTDSPTTHPPSSNLPSTSTSTSTSTSHPIPPTASRAPDSDPWTSYPPSTLSSAPTQPHPQPQPPHAAPSPNRQFYQPYTTYQDLPPYSDSENLIIPPMNQGFFVPELGMQIGFDTGSIFALEQLLGEGLLNLPMPAEGGAGYY